MITFPNAKINLGLNIIRKRNDGFHDIESCFYPIPWNDALEIVPSKTFKFKSYGLEIPGDSKSNLCVKAYELLRKDFKIDPIEIILLKKIPMGAGLGGGSADGAFMLKMLNEHFELGLTNKKLEQYALQLGSDCPFFIDNKPAIAQGRGELLEPIDLDLSGKFLAIQNPGIHISTKDAYAGIKPENPANTITSIVESLLETWKLNLKNDFEASIFPTYPELRKIKEELYKKGAEYASMTGSGSTIFGIFNSQPEMENWNIFSL